MIIRHGWMLSSRVDSGRIEGYHFLSIVWLMGSGSHGELERVLPKITTAAVFNDGAQAVDDGDDVPDKDDKTTVRSKVSNPLI